MFLQKKKKKGLRENTIIGRNYDLECNGDATSWSRALFVLRPFCSAPFLLCTLFALHPFCSAPFLLRPYCSCPFCRAQMSWINKYCIALQACLMLMLFSTSVTKSMIRMQFLLSKFPKAVLVKYISIFLINISTESISFEITTNIQLRFFAKQNMIDDKRNSRKNVATKGSVKS